MKIDHGQGGKKEKETKRKFKLTLFFVRLFGSDVAEEFSDDSTTFFTSNRLAPGAPGTAAGVPAAAPGVAAMVPGVAVVALGAAAVAPGVAAVAPGAAGRCDIEF